MAEQKSRGVSGRVFVVAVVIGVLATWGGLYLAFVGWRAGIQDRIEYGKTRMAAAVRPLAEVDPPGIAGDDWRAAVAESEAMLREVVGTGRLNREELERLGSDLDLRVSRARQAPGDAPAILARIWDDMARLKKLRTETGRPDILPPPDLLPGSKGPVR